MSSTHDFPCRVSADLRAKALREDQFIPVEFDWTDEKHMQAVLGDRPALIKAVAGLLDSYHAIDRAQRGFAGAINEKRALELLLPDLLRLREACAVIFTEER